MRYASVNKASLTISHTAFVLLLVSGCVRGTVSNGPPTGGDSPVEQQCDAGHHRCGDVCADDTATATCGDRCTPCPEPANGSATCDGSVCGIACDVDFFPCLGECLADGEAPCGTTLAANEWQRLTSGETGPRANPMLVYLDATSEYVMVGGSMGISQVPRPYDVQSMRLVDGVWKNRYPLDKIGLWGPEAGNTTAPAFTHERFSMTDPEDNTRPNWATYPGIPSYYQHAFYPASGVLFAYLWNHTFSYDIAARTWAEHDPPTDPAGGPQMPRLLWSAMAHDPADDELLLFGGGNVLDDDGRPGTWIYEIGEDRWRSVAGVQPGPRALAPLVTDPDRRQALLFGGDELDRLLSDTWIFDFASETWSEVTPGNGPSPRAGHTLLFLPTSRATVLLGGYEYSSTTDYVSPHYQDLPWEIWRFDWEAPAWQLIKRFDTGETQPDLWRSANFAPAAAVGSGDVVLLHHRSGRDLDASETWALRVDASAVDSEGSVTWGEPGGSVETRTGAYDPNWYTTGWPTPDAAGFATLLGDVSSNTWTEIAVPNRPAHNHDWGTAAIDPVRQVIFRWSGGHSAHCGTEVLEYDMVNNRFSLSFAPEIPLDFEFTNDQTPGEWSFDNNPWMTGHSYKMYAYSTAVGKMVLLKNPYTYYYDPDVHDFELDPGLTDVGGRMYTTLLAATPSGMVAWTPDGLWELDIPTATWDALVVNGGSLPAMTPDGNTLVHDGGNRLLLFATTDSNSGQVFAYDLGSNTLTNLDPTGMAAIAASSSTFFREAVYVASHDLVAIGTDFDDGSGVRTPVYDVGENRWYAYDFGTLQAGLYDVSLGLVVDAADRLWAIDTDSKMFLLKIDPDTASREPL